MILPRVNDARFGRVPAFRAILLALILIPAHASALRAACRQFDAPFFAFHTGTNPVGVAVGDLNRDGTPDVAVTNFGAGSVSILLGTGLGLYGGKTDYATGSYAYAVAIADLNADGKQDLVVSNQGSATLSVLLGNGDGTFGAKVDYGTGSNPLTVVIGDLNGDGKPDLAVASYNANAVSILWGMGTGLSRRAWTTQPGRDRHRSRSGT